MLSIVHLTDPFQPTQAVVDALMHVLESACDGGYFAGKGGLKGSTRREEVGAAGAQAGQREARIGSAAHVLDGHQIAQVSGDALRADTPQDILVTGSLPEVNTCNTSSGSLSCLCQCSNPAHAS